MHGPWPIPEGETVTAPTGYAEFRKEVLSPPRSLAEECARLRGRFGLGRRLHANACGGDAIAERHHAARIVDSCVH